MFSLLSLFSPGLHKNCCMDLIETWCKRWVQASEDLIKEADPGIIVSEKKCV